MSVDCEVATLREGSVIKHFVASAIIFHNEKVLLLEHKKLGTWLGPGGHIEVNESPDEAVSREIMEETGLKITIVSNCDVNLGTNEAVVLHNPYAVLCELINIPNDLHYHIDFVFICSSNTDQIRHDYREYKNIGWFSKAEIQALNIFPNYKKLLNKAFNEFVNCSEAVIEKEHCLNGILETV
ncbi:NUDIX hydrolase [Geotalea daltonii FRC-32]|uniref:NUDIX hydrolase n=1 Tax=Geotalea daltonii (strain DSM 22248 / JCM 15807 / FRC-32) TaxID=316067 RepID=B9LZY9_GEODF|nr:NUDIX domain-containing protein [Geotalea daltonii]ACM20769.1 NUDIX hydrolase [Geotalea daltonii FRC-32]